VSCASDAIRALNVAATEYPGGIAALACLLGRSPGVLYNKFSEADERYQITDREADALALEIRRETGSTAYMDAKCALFGGLFIALPEGGAAADDDVLTSLLDSMRALGDMARELTEARADGLITQDEFSAFELKARRLVGRIQVSVQAVKSQVCEPPVSLRAVL
jgi:hypothetical protein